MPAIFVVTFIFSMITAFSVHLIRHRSPLNFEHLELKWDDTAESIQKICQNKLEESRIFFDEIASIPLEKAHFHNVVLRFENFVAEFGEVINHRTFYHNVHPDSEVRDAANECRKEVSKLFVDTFSRSDLFARFAAVHSQLHKIPSSLNRKLVQEYYEDFIENGLELLPSLRSRLITLKKKLVDINSEFSRTLNNWKYEMWVTREELRGLPDPFIRGLKRSGELYRLTLNYPHYFPVMENAQNADLRRKLDTAFMSRGGIDNKNRLQEALKIRKEKAVLLGFNNHAEFRLSKRMAESPAKVMEFLNRIQPGLTAKTTQELTTLQKLKAEETEEELNQVRIESWDWRYYNNKLIKTSFVIDAQKIRQYFPLDHVLKNMFEIYETLLGVKFIPLENVPVWHESVQAVSVVNPNTAQEIARFYMDLFPRDGKYGHAAAFTLFSGRKLTDGSYRTPMSAIVTNFNPPTEEAPSLLLHEQVNTLFHELGHVMHQVLTRSPYNYFSGTKVKRDFVEAPSQMLENWVWRKESLQKLSRHFETGEPLDEETIDRILQAKNANSGLYFLRQLFFAKIDMIFHTLDNIDDFDTTKIWGKTMVEVMKIPPPPDTYPEAGFGHIMGRYDAGYYGYLWSKVYAQDMFTRFENEGLFNQKIGLEYRRWILEPGGTENPSLLVERFLQRQPNETAFLKNLGISYL